MFEETFKFSIKWIIPINKFKNFAKNGSFFSSDSFIANLPGVLYSLHCYPNGDNENFKNKMSLFLILDTGIMKSIFCEFTYHVKSASYTKRCCNTFTKTQNSWGCTIFYDCNKFLDSKYFVDNEFIVEVEGIMKGKRIAVLYEPIRSPFIQVMLQRTDKDITILAKGGIIKAHKNILKKRSKVFSSMVQSENTISVTEFSYTIIKTVIDFCYDVDITSDITDSAITELFTFSNKFEMDDLKKMIESILIEKLSDDTVTSLSNLSVKFNAKQLRECCVCYLLLKKESNHTSKFTKLCANFNSKIKSKSFAQFLKKKNSENPMRIKDANEIDKEICDEIIDRAFAETKCIQQSF